MEQNGKTTGVQVIARAADVLRALEPGGLSLSQISRRVDLARSTVHRIVTALESEVLVVPASPSGGYRLGPELARFAVSAGGELREPVRPFIERLRHEADETVDRAVLNRDRVLFIDQVATPHRLQALSAVVVSPTGAQHRDRQGPPRRPHRRAGREDPARTSPRRDGQYDHEPRRAARRPRPVEVRQGGLRSRGVHDRELRGGRGAPRRRRDANGVVAALSIPVPTARFASQDERLIDLLLKTCAEVSATLGANGHAGR